MRLSILMLAVLAIGCEVQIDEPAKPCDSPCPGGVCPVQQVSAVTWAQIPVRLRAENYGPSCGHASLETVLRWQGLHKMADWWRRNHWGAYSVDSMAVDCDRAGLRFAYTTNGDAAFLDWCARTRRGAAIHYFDRHAVTFAGYRIGKAVLIDNNNTRRDIEIPRAEFVAMWKAYGGRALTVVYSPPPPKPWI